MPNPRVLAGVVNLVNDRLTATIVAAFRADGVRAIVLKGASIREWLYEEREERISGDVDLLVPRAARDQVDARLRALALHYVGPSKVGRGRAYVRVWRQPQTGTLVELHESISGIAADDASAWRILSEQTIEMLISGEPAEVLDLPRRALHLALHAAHHGPSFARPIEDLERGLSAVPEQTWREAAVVAHRLDAVPALVAGLRLASGGPELVSRLALAEGAPAPVDVALRAGDAPPVAEGLAWLLGVPGTRGKLVFLGQGLVPPPGVMRAWSPLARRNAAGLAAVYLRRPFWLARHAIPAYAALRPVRAERDRPAADDRAPEKPEPGVTPSTLTRPAGDGWLALRMAAWSVVLPLLRRVVPLRRLARVAWAGGTSVRDPARERQIVRLSAALPRLRLRRGDANCLERGLLAYRFLAQASANPALVVAVRRGEAGVIGHAWTKVDGRPVHESEAALREFVTLVEFGPGGLAVGHQPAHGALPDRWK